MADTSISFGKRYGAWALIAGGSDGLGAAIADGLARRGMNCLLVARRAGPLEDTAAALRARYPVEVRVLTLDLAEADAAASLERAVAGIDLGMVVFNAGAEASGAKFIDAPYSDWTSVIQRNIGFLTDALYRFARKFAAQRRGALLIVGSEASLGGGARGAMYTATKGYALNLGESLWAELEPLGVDVLTLIFRIADTPMLRSVLARKGIPVEAVGAVPVADLAEATIDALGQGPVFNFDETSADAGLMTSAAVRRDRARGVSEALEGFYAVKEDAA